jgi:hypothetical protein
MHNIIKQFVAQKKIRPIAVQKTYIRALTVATLFNQYLSFSTPRPDESISTQTVSVEGPVDGEHPTRYRKKCVLI